MLVHVVNYDVTVDGTISPAPNLRLQAALPSGKKPGKMSWSGTLSDMKPLSLDSSSPRDGQSLVVNLDEVRVYRLLSIEME